ncbi:hypothetical protein FQZ97_1157120 [compost metagenome]
MHHNIGLIIIAGEAEERKVDGLQFVFAVIPVGEGGLAIGNHFLATAVAVENGSILNDQWVILDEVISV